MKKNGAFYVVSPWALTWDDENYYLVAYDAAAEIIKHYRVDKMRDTEILEADRKGEESFKNFDLAAFAKKTFGMYGGVDAEVTLECSSIKNICKVCFETISSGSRGRKVGEVRHSGNYNRYFVTVPLIFTLLFFTNSAMIYSMEIL